MKRLAVLIISSLVVVTNVAQNSDSKKKSNDDFEKMAFEVELNKSKYLLTEPIFVKFKFANNTAEPLTAYEPLFLKELELVVKFNGEKTVFREFSPISGKPRRIMPTVFESKTVLTRHEILHPSFVGQFFPYPGNYELQFILQNSGRSKILTSNPIRIKIEEPIGLNRDALDFLNINDQYFGLSSWAFSSKEGISVLETFVKNYGESVYGEVAISVLASIYLSQGEINKAKTQLERIKSSPHQVISVEASKSLAEIEKRIKEKVNGI